MTSILLLNEILIIFGLSAAVIFVCHRLRIPVIVGYLLTGVLAGPYGFGLVGEIEAVRTLAEVGIVSLLFTIGLEFSFRNLLQFKRSILLGGSLQLLLTIAAVAMIAHRLGHPPGEAVYIGCLISLSSTAIVLKLLQERAEVETPQGGTILGILIFQDIIVVPMILLTPFLAGASGGKYEDLLILLAEEIGIVLLVIVAAKWIIPRLFFRITQTRNRELFLISVIVLCLSVAWLTYAVGLSLALGAFLAGLVISESEYGHQALANILPFRDVFTSFFFVSIGMLLNLGFLLQHLGNLLTIALGVLLLKTLTAAMASAWIGLPLRAVILVGMSLGQVGEFSFILSDVGTRYGLLAGDQYQIFLAISVLTMMMTPFVVAMAPRAADLAVRLPLPKRLKRGSYPVRIFKYPHEKDHLVIVGFGVNGRNLARAARAGGIPYVVIEMNPEVVRDERKKGEPIYFGDATQEAVLQHADVKSARAVVIVINDPAAARRITGLVRRMNPRAYIVVRTRFLLEMRPLLELGANEVVPEEFETSVEIFSRVLSKYLLPKEEIEKFVRDVRADGYEMFRSLSREATASGDLKLYLPEVEMTSFRVEDRAPALGKTLAETEMRKKYGVTLLAIRRGNQTISIPDTETRFMVNDLLFVVGPTENIARVRKCFQNPE